MMSTPNENARAILAAFRDQLIEIRPQISAIDFEIKQFSSNIYDVIFRSGERACKFIYFYDERIDPNLKFEWDQSFLFRVQSSEIAYLADLMSSWLCEQAMPSLMQQRFPELEIGELASYYEAGKPILGEFITSWNAIEQFYDTFEGKFVPEAKALIAQMRSRGYDQKLRAGQSLWTLVLSRSRRHGLRRDQSSICFFFHEKSMSLHTSFGDEYLESDFGPIAFTTEVEEWLERLVREPID